MAKVKVDFNITSTPYTIRVEDMSEWGPIEGKPTIIEITSPGYSTFKTHWFAQKKSNIFNSNNLDMNCVDCPECIDGETLIDGVYTIEVKGSPETFHKKDYYLKTDLFDMEMNKVLVDRIKSNGYTEKFKKHFLEVKFLLWSAEAHLELDSLKKAQTLFELAVSELEDLKHC